MAQVFLCIFLCFFIISGPTISSSETIRHDGINPPQTTSQNEPTTVANNPAPTVVTVNPNPDAVPAVPVPSTDPVNSPIPVTNPITTPSTPTPVTNPVTTYPPPTTGIPATTPVTNPIVPPGSTPTNLVPPLPGSGGSPAGTGKSWCIVKGGVSESKIQAAVDYACGIGGADCTAIQQGQSCYNPNSLQNHASYAFNSIFQKNPVQTSCDFGGIGMITTSNPSTGTCVYPASSLSTSSSSSSSSSSPSSATTPSPSLNPSTSMSISLQPLIGFTILAASTVTGRLILHI